jgi:DNA-binding NarL/FixJ family response regulator
VIHRVLVVDDFAPWRQHVLSTLQNTSDWQVVGEAADGPDAINKALALRPDLILLDVGLPTVNGIEAARRILARNPNLRILFVSEHQSWDIAEAALCTGARGYICKSDAGRELLPAMETIVGGQRFVAARFGGRVVDNTSRRLSSGPRRHEAAFYDSEKQLLDEWTIIAEVALNSGATFIVVAGDSILYGLQESLRARGVNLARAVGEGRYVSFTVAEIRPKFMVDDWPDETRFWEDATSMMMAAAKASKSAQPSIVACGEIAPTLCRQGNTEAAIRVEQLWDELARMYQLDVFCGYSGDCACRDRRGDVFDRICATHTGGMRES